MVYLSTKICVKIVRISAIIYIRQINPFAREAEWIYYYYMENFLV